MDAEQVQDAIQQEEDDGGQPAAPDDEVSRLRGELEATREQERAAVGRLREALLASEPALEPSMVSGATLSEV